MKRISLTRISASSAWYGARETGLKQGAMKYKAIVKDLSLVACFGFHPAFSGFARVVLSAK